MSDNPYRDLPDHRYWRRAVAVTERFAMDPVVATRFSIAATDRVATAGSCFAQHIARRLSRLGFNYQVVEDGAGLPEAERTRRQFGTFSARYGNIYTARQLLQLFQEAFEGRVPAERAWQRADGRWVDALRPAIEPDGFTSEDEVARARAAHLDAVRTVLSTCDVFVFTLGLTEHWYAPGDGTVFPVAPGVSGGAYRPGRHAFGNFSVAEVAADMDAFLAGLRRVNPAVRVLLTVSPVPLVATYEDRHVLVSNTLSKSVLRAAADQVHRAHPFVDYFPSFEIITGNYADSAYFEPDYRNVTPVGVDHVMRSFLRHYAEGHAGDATGQEATAPLPPPVRDPDDVVCDEEALDPGRGD